jgi:hypothetical protein
VSAGERSSGSPGAPVVSVNVRIVSLRDLVSSAQAVATELERVREALKGFEERVASGEQTLPGDSRGEALHD